MKKLLLMFMAVSFMISCTKSNIVEDVNPVEQNLLEASVAVIGVGGGGIENPFPVVVVLPPSVLTLTNPTYVAQFARDTVFNLTPNSPVFSDELFNSLDGSFVGVRCPSPQPPPVSHTFSGGNPVPGCTIIPDVFSETNFTFSKISSTRIKMLIKYIPTDKIIYSKELLYTSPRTYSNQGDIKSIITNQEAINYNTKPSQATITPIITKFFNFFNTRLRTSN
jgi:hypothetical protein